MKKLIPLTFFAITLFWTGCNQQTGVSQMLEKPETRSQIFSGILHDSLLINQFMDSMMKHDNARMMMNRHKAMMGDTAMMQNMMKDMMKDGKMMGHMMKMMNGEGMMSKECMESCMKMMSDKGMTMDMGTMKH